MVRTYYTASGRFLKNISVQAKPGLAINVARNLCRVKRAVSRHPFMHWLGKV